MVVSIRPGPRPPSRAVASRAVLAAILILAPPAVAMAQSGAPRTPIAPAPRAPAPRAPSPRSPAGGPTTAVALVGLTGYTHPEVTPQSCHLVNAGRRDCLIPGRTAGRYRIAATGASMAIGAHPRQQLTIIVSGRICTQKLDLTAWSGRTREIAAVCEVAILSDAPVLVSVVYADLQALKVATGPEVRFERMPWSGVLEMRDASAP